MANWKWSIAVALSLAWVSSSDPDFTCLGADKQNITFLNHDSPVLVDGLWTVRVMQGGYSSQTALNYAAYVFMREKLGINVTFYPTTDHSTYWSYYSNGCGYPSCYWYWLSQDLMDVEFEYWPTQEEAGGAFDFYAAGSVQDGFVGVYGEMGWYLPKYFVDEHPTAVVPWVLKTNTTIRDLLVQGSKTGGSQDHTLTFTAENRAWTTGFDVPNSNDSNPNPIIWGSSEGYAMSQYSYDLKNALLGGLGMDFVTTAASGESALLAIVQDLYDNRAPFIANIYVPDDNFAVSDNSGNTTTLQQFEKVALPRNPDQSTTDECYVNAQCGYPIEPLKKAANTLLPERFPEAYEFFSGFSMPSRQLAAIINNYRNIDTLVPGMDEHFKWLNASCEWLKDPTSVDTWNNSKWLVSIDRYDCIPGCGLEYEDSAVYIGGTCDYTTSRAGDTQGTCNCDYDELYGDFCDQSCDGLLGPMLDSSDNTYSFEFCSGHGTCDTTNYLCTCDEGYGKSGCQKKYDLYSFPIAIAAFVIAVSSVLCIVCGACVVWLRMNTKYKTVKALSVDMTTLFTVGLMFLVCSNIALVAGGEATDASCVAWQWLFGLGGILAILSPLLKAYRVSRVFHGGKMLRAVKITDKMLMNTLLKCVLLEVVICTAYTVFHQINGGVSKYYNHDDLRVETQCNDSAFTRYISLGSYAYFFVMLCALTKYSYGTRRALSVFKESTCAYSSSFLSLFCTLIVFGFNMATDDPTFQDSVQCFAVIIVVTAVIALFYGTRVWTFYNEPQNRNVTDIRSPAYTASATGNLSTNNTSTMSVSANTANHDEGVDVATKA